MEQTVLISVHPLTLADCMEGTDVLFCWKQQNPPTCHCWSCLCCMCISLLRRCVSLLKEMELNGCQRIESSRVTWKCSQCNYCMFSIVRRVKCQCRWKGQRATVRTVQYVVKLICTTRRHDSGDSSSTFCSNWNILAELFYRLSQALSRLDQHVRSGSLVENCPTLCTYLLSDGGVSWKWVCINPL